MKNSSMNSFNFDINNIDDPVVFVKHNVFSFNEAVCEQLGLDTKIIADLLSKRKIDTNDIDLFLIQNFEFKKILKIDGGLLFKITSVLNNDLVNIPVNYIDILADYVKLSHDNVLLWAFASEVQLNQEWPTLLSQFVENLVLHKIIKQSSGFFINTAKEEVLGKKATDLFQMNNPEIIQSIKRFFENDLFVDNVLLNVASPLHNNRTIPFRVSLKGYHTNGILTYLLLTSHDITEQLAKDEQLSITKKMLHDAEIVGKQAAFVFWPSSGKSWWSDNNYPLYGINKDDEGAEQKILSMHFVLLEYRSIIIDLIDNVKIGEEKKANFKIKKSNNEIRDFEIICTRFQNAYDNEETVNGLIRDITEEKILNDAFKENSDAWEKYSETVPGAFYSYKINAKGEASVGYYNQKLIELIQINDTVTQQNILDYYIACIHPDDLASYYNSITLAISEVSKWEHKHRLKQKDGSYKWIRGLASPKIEENGDITFYGILIDVTDEENRNTALNIANHKYALATQAARMGIWEYDLQKNTIDFDHQLKHIYFISDSESSSIDFNEWIKIIHKNFVDKVSEAFQEAVLNEKELDLTYKVAINGEEYYHNSMGIVLLDQLGKPYKILGVTRDVTETISYQHKLEDVNSIYDLATQAANMGIWEWDLNTNEIIWNDSHYLIFNVDKTERPITYEKFIRLIHKDDLEELQQNLAAAAHTGNTKLPIFRAVLKDKGVCYFEAACTTTFDEKGVPSRMMGVVWEVTENIKRQEELNHTNIKYKLATKTAKMGIWDLEFPSMQLSWDDELHQIFGTNRNEEITYQKWRDLIHPEDIARLERHLELALNGDREYNEVFRHKLSDGSWAYNKVRAIVLRNEANQPTKVLGVSWDVSDMIQYQKNLESLNLKYRLATKSIRIGLWDYNPRTNRVIWDPALAEMYGIPNSFEESFPLEQILAVIDEKDRARFHQSIKDSIKNKWIEFNESYTVNNPITGKVRHIEIVCGPQFDDDGNIERMLGLSLDNTESVERELELVKVLETREKLFNVIAHDLKGPISNLIGVSEFLTNDYDDLADAEIKEFLLMIRKSSLTASNLMNNLITWTRNISNRIPFKPKYAPVAKFFSTVISFYEETMKLKGIEAKIDERSFTDKIFVDVNMLDTILRNLVGNAIKFSSKGDLITLSAIKKEKEVQLIVEDSGIGMTQKQIDMVLKLDGKFQKAGTAKEKGTGLGLIIVQDFIKKHNGLLTISSSENNGSIFKIIIPQP